jgi:thioredoxin reductase (NADPH)
VVVNDEAVARRDCLIIGGGPAGLTAAIDLGCFHLLDVIDAGQSCCAAIRFTRNLAGLPNGISGKDLLERRRRRAAFYGAKWRQGDVVEPEATNGHFIVHSANDTIAARTVLLAPGVHNGRPTMADEAFHDATVARGQLRYFPIRFYGDQLIFDMNVAAFAAPTQLAKGASLAAVPGKRTVLA